MPCCKCKEHSWPDPQPVIYTDEADKKDYCLFHAPLKPEGMSVENFNAQVFARIDAVKARNKANDADDFCVLSGTIFPGYISFSAYRKDNPLPGIDLLESTFTGNTNFFEATFGGMANFFGAKFSDEAIFTQATFDGRANFTSAEFGGRANFWKAKFGGRANFAMAKFGGEANFDIAKFKGKADFNNARFGDEFFPRTARFKNATFGGKANFWNIAFNGATDFTEAIFNYEADFTWSTFGNKADFQGVKSEKNALRLHSLTSASLTNLNFTSMETEFFSFKGCDWPNRLWPETREKPDYKACEELYRSLKQKAANEHDQPMVSKWHYREKLMGLFKSLGNANACKNLEEIENGETCPCHKTQALIRLLLSAPGLLLSLNFWYWAISGYGERERRAGVFLALLAVLPFVLNAFPHPIETFPFSAQVDNALSHFPFAKDIQGQGGWLRLGKGLSQLLIALQAALFAFALRNRFRR